MKRTVFIKSNTFNNVVKEICTWLLIVILMTLFFYSGMDKVLNFEKLRIGLGNSPLVSHGNETEAASLVILMLLTVSSLLLLGFWYQRLMKIGLYAYLLIIVFFTIYINIILTKPDSIPCTCIGIAESWGLNWNQHLLLNLFIISITVLTIWLYKMENNKTLNTINGAKPEAHKKTGIYKKKGGIRPC